MYGVDFEINMMACGEDEVARARGWILLVHIDVVDLS